MIINDLNVEGVAVLPHETNPPLVIDTDTVLPLAIAFQRFESISRRRRQVLQFACSVKLPQFALGHAFDCPETADALTAIKPFGVFGPERLDHPPGYYVIRLTSSVKQKKAGPFGPAQFETKRFSMRPGVAKCGQPPFLIFAYIYMLSFEFSLLLGPLVGFAHF
jgi:hypothetical protein